MTSKKDFAENSEQLKLFNLPLTFSTLIMKILSFITGLTVVAGIVFAGYYSTDHSHFVVWFGVITALAAPLAFEFLSYPFKSRNNQILKDLSKVAQLESLIIKAKDTETRIRLLEEQQKDLDKLIAYESKRRSLIAEREIYILQGSEALTGLNRVNVDIEKLTSEKAELPAHLTKLADLVSGVKNEDDLSIPLGSKILLLKKRNFRGSIYSELTFEILRLFLNLFLEIDKKLKKLQN